MDSLTTGHSSFADCLRHSAKHIKHSANTLPSVTLGKKRSANCTSATVSLPSTFCRVLGKEKSSSRRQVTVTNPLSSVFFGTRQIGQFYRVPAIMALGKDGSSGPHRQSLCRVSNGLALGKESSSGPVCQSLCRVRWAALGKGSFFAECLDHSTRQRRLYRFPGFLLCRVPWS
jgi:hypothetical protein